MKAIKVVAIVVGVPALLALDVWLAFQLGGWVTSLAHDDGTSGAFLGTFGFAVLAGTQGFAFLVLNGDL